MLISKTVTINWNAKIKKHYVDLGYIFTKIKDPFEVKIEDLTCGSNAEVDVMCDYCGAIYKKEWYRYLQENDDTTVHKDCCSKCKKHKIIETAQTKYGVNSVLSLDSIKEKVAMTNLERYGAENPFGSEVIKERIAKTNIDRYGKSSPMKNPEIISKASQTCMERYGVPFYIHNLVFYGEQNPHWKGGVSYHGIERSTTECVHWRTRVFHRDRYTCQCCGMRNGNGVTVKLNAHHIHNWRDYPDLRYDDENGITLCEKCHILFHRQFGKRHNNKDQLQSFLFEHGKNICWTNENSIIRNAGQKADMITN